MHGTKTTKSRERHQAREGDTDEFISALRTSVQTLKKAHEETELNPFESRLYQCRDRPHLAHGTSAQVDEPTHPARM